MEPRAILVAKRSFVLLVFLLPAVILVIFGLDSLPSTEGLITLCIGTAMIFIFLIHQLYTRFYSGSLPVAQTVSESPSEPVATSVTDEIVNDLPPSYEGESESAKNDSSISRRFTSQRNRDLVCVEKN